MFPRGHLFTVSGTLWAHVLHVRSSIRLAVCGPPLTSVGDRPGVHSTKVVLFAKPKSYSGFGLDVDVRPAGQGLVLIILFVGSSLVVGLP